MPMDIRKYPVNWKELSHYIRFVRAEGLCEKCGAIHGKPHPITGSKVILTTAHLDHDLKNNSHDNLMAMCQKCHLSYDAKIHLQHRRENELKNQIDNGQLSLPLP